MGGRSNPDEEWKRFREEVEFFGISNIEEFKEESEVLKDWDTRPFLDKFIGLKSPMEALLNAQLGSHD